MADADSGDDGPEHQHEPANAAVLVLSRLQGKFAAVAYRAPEPSGALFWDLQYFFDDLARAGENTTPYKMIQSLRSLCQREEVLSVKDLHFRKRNMRPNQNNQRVWCQLSYSLVF